MRSGRNFLREQCIAVPKNCGIQQFFRTVMHCALTGALTGTLCTYSVHYRCTHWGTVYV